MTKRAQAGEMRQHFITGKWVMLSTNRAHKPSDWSAQRTGGPARAKYAADCPFCNTAAWPQLPDTVRLPDDPDQWQVHVFPNKYPALTARDELKSWQVGPYRAMESVGYHDVLATRWHHQTEATISAAELSLQFEALLLRFRQLAAKSAVNYIQVIKNHGAAAGASLAHPHQQIFALPILPDAVQDLLTGAQEVGKQLGREPFGVLLDFEIEDGSRVITENEFFVAFCPFASRFAFEVCVMPRYHEPYFQNTDPTQRGALADIVQEVLARLYQGFNDPPFNYYIYSAPCDETGFVCDRAAFDQFRWHICIVPRFGSLGGLEVSAGVEVVTEAPETAARFLREAAYTV